MRTQTTIAAMLLASCSSPKRTSEQRRPLPPSRAQPATATEAALELDLRAHIDSGAVPARPTQAQVSRAQNCSQVGDGSCSGYCSFYDSELPCLLEQLAPGMTGRASFSPPWPAAFPFGAEGRDVLLPSDIGITSSADVGLIMRKAEPFSRKDADAHVRKDVDAKSAWPVLYLAASNRTPGAGFPMGPVIAHSVDDSAPRHYPGPRNHPVTARHLAVYDWHLENPTGPLITQHVAYALVDITLVKRGAQVFAAWKAAAAIPGLKRVVPVRDQTDPSLAGYAYCKDAPEGCTLVAVSVKGEPKYLRAATGASFGSGGGYLGAEDGPCKSARPIPARRTYETLHRLLANPPYKLVRRSGSVRANETFRAAYDNEHKVLPLLGKEGSLRIELESKSQREFVVATYLSVTGTAERDSFAECNKLLRALNGSFRQEGYQCKLLTCECAHRRMEKGSECEDTI